MRITLSILIAAGVCLSLHAQTPRVPPRDGFVFHDEHKVGMFEVQRWVAAANPEVSASGMCDCITVVYRGAQRILIVDPGDITATEIDARSGQDINRDSVPELIVSQYTGGAHCCSSTTVYSVSTELKRLLDIDSGNCRGEFEDLDKDGTMEFVTCDDGWAYEYCSFADSPMPKVVFAYTAAAGQYLPATPRYREHFQAALAESIASAEKEIAGPAGNPADAKCTVLEPVLGLMYSGRLDEGLALLHRLYRMADLAELEMQTIDKVRKSPFWTEASK